MNKKKMKVKVGIILILSIAVIATIFVVNTPKKIATLSGVKTNPAVVQSQEVNPYEKIGNLDYKILRNEKVKEDSSKKLVFDISTSANLTDEQILFIGKEIYKIASDKDKISKVDFNVFTTDDVFKVYKGVPLSGHISNYLSTHDSKNNVAFKRDTVVKDEQFEFDKLGFDICETKVLDDKKSAEVSAIISEGTIGDILDTSKGISSITKSENDKMENINIKFYNSKEDFDVNKISWSFNDNSNIVSQYKTSTF